VARHQRDQKRLLKFYLFLAALTRGTLTVIE
jgi:hypothetical protein